MATTKLGAVNELLAVIGEAPVEVINSGLTYEGLADLAIDQVSREVQSRGWWFNTEYKVEFTPNGSNKIVIADDVLSADPSSPYQDYIAKGGFLYNMTEHTDTFTDKVELDVIYERIWEDLPEVARRYITVKAGRKFQKQYLGSDLIHKFNEEDERDAFIMLQGADMLHSDANIFSDSYESISTLER